MRVIVGRIQFNGEPATLSKCCGRCLGRRSSERNKQQHDLMAASRCRDVSGHSIFAPWHSHKLVVRIAIYSPPSPTTHHGFRGHQKTAEASVKHLRTVCFCGNENRTGMVLPPELVGLIDYLPTLSESVRRVVLAIRAMTSSHNDDSVAGTGGYCLG